MTANSLPYKPCPCDQETFATIKNKKNFIPEETSAKVEAYPQYAVPVCRTHRRLQRSLPHSGPTVIIATHFSQAFDDTGRSFLSLQGLHGLWGETKWRDASGRHTLVSLKRWSADGNFQTGRCDPERL